MPWKLLAVAFIFIGITAVSVSMTFAAIAVQSAVRSYVAGEGQYSKAQRDAVFLLHRYGQTGDPAYLRSFDRALAVPIGDRVAREQMQKPSFDRDVARQGFLAGDNHPDDVASLIWFFRCCSQLPPLRSAIDLWTRADEHIDRLQSLAREMRAAVEAPWPSGIALSELLSQVESVNESIRPIEAAFTATLGVAARSISSLLMLVTATIILLLVALGTYLSLRIVRSIRSSSEQYRTIMHSASDGLIVVDRADGRVLEINDCAEAMIGIPASQLIGVAYNGLFGGPDVNLQPGHDQAGLQLSTLLANSGHPIEVEVKCSATSWNQRPAQLAIIRDVSKRLRTERMLRVATNAMANMSEAVVIADERFRVVSVNEAFTAITGYHVAEVAGKVPGYRGVQSADRRRVRQIMQSLQRDGRWQGELENVRKTGAPYPMRLSLAAIPETNGRITHYVGVFSDNSAFRDYENRLKHLASHDMLTDLPNRAALEARTARAIARAQSDGSRLALLFIDLDGFKGVNDTWGHAAGDALLTTLSHRIQRCLTPAALVARVGGDEFNVLLEEVGTGEEVARLARQLLAAAGEPVQWKGQSISLSASIGISFYPEDATDVDALVTHADMAMYQAKTLGRNNFQVFSRQASVAVTTRPAVPCPQMVTEVAEPT